MNESEARVQILELVKNYYHRFHTKKIYAESDRINYAGRVYDSEEMTCLVDCALEFWLTSGRYTDMFEENFTKFLNVKYCSVVNSGSSANLLAFMALTSDELGERAVKPGDEVITVAAGFPTTVAPIVQFGATPVFVDVTIPKYNIDCDILERALSSKTKAVMLAHTLGNPFNLKKVKAFCNKHKLWLIEDNCDALGSKYCMNKEWQYTGTIGDIGTSSFYPPHHITMGEGGAVYTNDSLIHKLVRSFRDWGRDCRCPSGRDNFCGRRFEEQYGELPAGYDHKYVYSHFGYNLKATDLQAAIGVAQLKKLPAFIETRRKNFDFLYGRLEYLQDKLILPLAEEDSEPSWFGFPITVRNENERSKLIVYLEKKGIQTRLLFAGNMLKQPCFNAMRKNGKGYRVVGNLKNTDMIMNNTFWVGVYPGISAEMLNYITQCIDQSLLTL